MKQQPIPPLAPRIKRKLSFSGPLKPLGPLMKCENSIFAKEPIMDKKVGILVGIGPKSEANLNKLGIFFAYEIVGYYLLFKKDVDKLNTWLIEKAGIMNGAYRKQLIDDIVSWCQLMVF